MGLMIRLDPEETTTILSGFLRDSCASAGARGFVLGLSGGLDSAVVACLAARAVGPQNVVAIHLPTEVTSSEDRADAMAAAGAAGITLYEIPIQAAVDELVDADGNGSVLHKGASVDRTGPGDDDVLERAVRANVMARTRMTILYQEAQRRRMLVVGTGNKSEALVGYFTKYGDGGVDLQPLGDLYKTQVRELAAHLGLDRALIDKAPSAGLWEGQTDEKELGVSYEVLDRILLGLEIGLDPKRIAADADVDVEEVVRFENVRRTTQHKRTAPLVPKLGIRTTGSDWRDPTMGTAKRTP